MDIEPTKPEPTETTKAIQRAIVKKIAINVTVGIIVTVGSTLIVNLIDRAFSSDDSDDIED